MSVLACLGSSHRAAHVLKVDRFRRSRPGELIAVYDEYGVNRSGYLIVRCVPRRPTLVPRFHPSPPVSHTTLVSRPTSPPHRTPPHPTPPPITDTSWRSHTSHLLTPSQPLRRVDRRGCTPPVASRRCVRPWGTPLHPPPSTRRPHSTPARRRSGPSGPPPTSSLLTGSPTVLRGVILCMKP